MAVFVGELQFSNLVAYSFVYIKSFFTIDLVGFMVAFVLLSICYEGLKAFRETIRIKELAQRRQSPHGKMYSESHPLVETVRFA